MTAFDEFESVVGQSSLAANHSGLGRGSLMSRLHREEA